MEVKSQLHASAPLPSGKNPGPHWIGNCVGPRASLEVTVKSYDPCRDSNPGTTSTLRSQRTELLRLLKFVWYLNLKLIVEFIEVFISPKERFENWPFPSKMVHPTKWHITSVCLRAAAYSGNNHMVNMQSSCLSCNLLSSRLKHFTLARRESTNLLQQFTTPITSPFFRKR